MSNVNKTVNPEINPDLFRMLANFKNDINVANYSKVLRPTDETLMLKGGAKGIRLYDEVRQDGHAYAVLEKRKMKVTAREWEVRAAEDNDERAQAAAELVEKALKRISFDSTCNALLDAVLYGYAVAEIQWELVGNHILPKKIARHSQARFAFDGYGNPRLITPLNPSEGEALPARKFIVHRHDEDGSDPYGRGLGKVLFWHILFKREGVGFWAYFLEKFASPTPIGKYPLGTPPVEQNKLLDNLVAMVQSGALVLPLGSEVSFLGSARDGKATYGEWCSFWDEQTSIAVLGENLSTSLSGDGSRAATETHLEVSDGIADADADLLSATLNQTLVQWIVDFNMPDAPVPTIWRPRTKNESALEDLKTKRAARIAQELENTKTSVAMGFKPDEGLEAHLSEIFDKEMVVLSPQDKIIYQDLIAAGQSTPFQSTPFQTSPYGGSFSSIEHKDQSHDQSHDHGINAIVDQIEDMAQPVIDGWLNLISDMLKDAAQNGDSLDDVADKLLILYPELETTPLIDLLGYGQAVAELTGRADLEDDVANLEKAIQ
ncbi:DUF935 domain-containing protein [Bartonella sp. HY761]|uniref:DUF935 domain-containing protein n=1 Tax=Bartonella sp. HY761 TaxID=2979330 RepID=UPI002202A076|nr:DUF935 family protein [Bartonella sp. HY761]UXN07525.1 DUF935 domain-containing protein [Bartonella sp. HY761]